MEVGFARPGCLLPKDVKAQLEGVISEHVASAVAQCAAIFEARIEAVRWEERRRARGDQEPDWEAPNSGAWSRGFFDSKVQETSYPSTPAHSAAEGKLASGRKPLETTAQTPFGEVDCVKVLTDAFSIKDRLHSALAECQEEEEEASPSVLRPLSCSPDDIVTRTFKMMEKLQAAGGPVSLPPAPAAGEPAAAAGPAAAGSLQPPPGGAGGRGGSKHRRPSKAPLPAGQHAEGEGSRQGSKTAPPPPGQPRRSEDEAHPHPLASSSCPSSSSPHHQTGDSRLSRDDKVREIRQRTAQTIELGRMLEELAADLQTAQIISPSAERADGLREFRKSSTMS